MPVPTVGQEVDVGVSRWWVSEHACTLAFAERDSKLSSQAFPWKVLCSVQRGSGKSLTGNGLSGMHEKDCGEGGKH